ncbi:hypothetical protein BVRB_9g202850 [Beta vulgaris subsp. vulgaris]|nr:hypothetical protein BVRB_9g202850 [Beta vulgaris subsp. vulgaris]
MASLSLALNFATLNSPIILRGHHRNSFHEFPKSLSHFSHHKLKHDHLHICKAAASSSSSSSSSITEYDLYDLLGIDSSSDQGQIKRAYRSLQKRCHPDIAGLAGHDMAIILNEAYAILSDPISRYVYDKEQAKLTELKGYTGRPMYSVWQGSETEERAVFVDEVRCVGCLKCALFADKTFAIESTYGRARVVAQWADPEDKIQASIDVCPVSCISMVERSDLAALEFIMSKQPRGKVRIGAGTTGGVRTFDVFSELKVFHKRLDEALTRKSNQDSKFSEPQTDTRTSAIQTIRSISNWLYWKLPASNHTSSNLALMRTNKIEPDINKLRDAATAAKKLLRKATSNEEYWAPTTPVLPKKTVEIKSSSDTKRETPLPSGKDIWGNMKRKNRTQGNRYVTGIPILLGVAAAITVGSHGTGEAVGGLEGHIYGSSMLQIVNSFELQVILAGVTWYLIGAYAVQIVASLVRRD